LIVDGKYILRRSTIVREIVDKGKRYDRNR
jgi:hypothetical protein